MTSKEAGTTTVPGIYRADAIPTGTKGRVNDGRSEGRPGRRKKRRPEIATTSGRHSNPSGVIITPYTENGHNKTGATFEHSPRFNCDGYDHVDVEQEEPATDARPEIVI